MIPESHAWVIWTALVLALTGCQAVPARVASCESDGVPRKAVAVAQVLGDTAREVAAHPLRSAGSAVIEPLLAAREASYGLTRKRVGLHLAPAPGPVPAARPTLDPDALEAELTRDCGDGVEPAAISLYATGDDALAALRRAIATAERRIDVLMYLWDNDPVGWEVARLLAGRAGPTLPVRVLVDGGGNLLQGEPAAATAAEANAVVCWLARQPHVRVIRTRDPFFRFDHRKLVLVDGRLAWSGGRNFTHESFAVAHDLTYTLAGPLTATIAARYENFWREQGGPPGPPLPAPPALDGGAANGRARLVRTRPLEADLARAVYTAVARARHHVYVTNPYLTDGRLLVELAGARRRGVDVRVVLTLDSGSSVTDASNRVTANRLLRAGVRVYLYPGLLHAKATSVDGVWAYLGTGNFDALSLRHNREFGVAVSHGPVVAELERRFVEPDLRPEWEVREPLPVTAYEYVVEAVASLFG